MLCNGLKNIKIDEDQNGSDHDIYSNASIEIRVAQVPGIELFLPENGVLVTSLWILMNFYLWTTGLFLKAIIVCIVA